MGEMPEELSDQQLLQQYVRDQSEAAFRALVERHVDLVYGAAYRQLNNRATAEETTQTVFVMLAARAASLAGHPSLAGWLYHTSVNQARQQFRGEQRRRLREEAAVQLANTMQANEPPALAGDLDEAMLELHDDDREAVVLRFFKQMPLKQVGAALGIDEDTAQKRISRAVEKLRQIFVKRGIAVSAVALSAALSVTAAQAAPVGLAATVTAAAALQGTSAASTVTLIKFMAWTKLKTAVVAAAALILITGTTVVAVKTAARNRPVDFWPGEGNANDPKGGNNGAMMNGASFEPGKIGQAFSFDGTNQYVEIPDGPSLSPARSFSIVAWINPLPGNGPRIIFAKWGDTDDYDNHRSYVFCLEHDNVLRFGIADAAHQWDTAFHEFDSQATVTPEAWSHVAAVYDHDTGMRRIYLNGEMVAARVDPPITVLSTNTKAGIGAVLRSSAKPDGFFAGKIDEAAVFNRALSASQIRDLYRAGMK
jgi:RNA polymerase sigma factor (sigma-70 family)